MLPLSGLRVVDLADEKGELCGRLLADLGADVVRVYAFDADSGSLTPAHDLTVTAKPGAGPRHIAFHPSGAYAYLLNELNGTLGVYAFDAESGRFDEIHTVTTLPADFTDENYAADVQLLPSGDFLYASNRGHDSIARFAVDAGSGRVEFIGHTPIAYLPRRNDWTLVAGDQHYRNVDNVRSFLSHFKIMTVPRRIQESRYD